MTGEQQRAYRDVTTNYGRGRRYDDEPCVTYYGHGSFRVPVYDDEDERYSRDASAPPPVGPTWLGNLYPYENGWKWSTADSPEDLDANINLVDWRTDRTGHGVWVEIRHESGLCDWQQQIGTGQIRLGGRDRDRARKVIRGFHGLYTSKWAPGH